MFAIIPSSIPLVVSEWRPIVTYRTSSPRPSFVNGRIRFRFRVPLSRAVLTKSPEFQIYRSVNVFYRVPCLSEVRLLKAETPLRKKILAPPHLIVSSIAIHARVALSQTQVAI